MPCRNVVRLANLACPSGAKPVSSLSLQALEPDAEAELMNSLADLHAVLEVKRLRGSRRPAALLGPAAVMLPRPVVVTPPPTTMPPGRGP